MPIRHTKLLFLAVGLSVATSAAAQTDAPVERVPATTIAAYPVGAFLESIVIRPDGDMLIVEHTDHNVLRVSPDGSQQIFAHLGDGVAGLAVDLNGTALATSGYQEDEGFVTLLDDQGGEIDRIPVPGSRFLNGATLLRPGVFLAADSITGQIYRIDTQRRTADSWLADESLAPNPDQPTFPGANGIKIHEGVVYVTNSGRAHVVRIPLGNAGQAGTPEIWINEIVLDDFDFAADGTLYATTHIFDSVVRIEPDGSVTTIATADDSVTGSTAVAFGRTEADDDQLYVVTDGGVFLPPEAGLVPPEIVRLDVGERAMAPLERLSHVAYPGQTQALQTWLVRCDTAPNTDALRHEVGPSYLRFLEAHFDQIAFAGQLFEDDSAEPSSRLYFLTSTSADEALRTMEASPYYTSGLYSSCSVAAFNGVIGGLLNGVAWGEAQAQVASD